MQYDLEERTRNFGKEIIKLSLEIIRNSSNQNIIDQLLRSATSVGANYMEANGACSRKDFKNKIAFCRKEIQETKYWIELLAVANNDEKVRLRKLWKEAHELTLIINKIFSSLNN